MSATDGTDGAGTDGALVTTRIHAGPDALVVEVAGIEHRLDVGTDRVASELHHDPPWAEELTNAIGAVIDHLDDVVRVHPFVEGAPTWIAGPLLPVLADVELGTTAALPVTLPRDAVEEVFRTLATEPAADRRHNPGLPAAHVESIVAVSCVAVGVMRRLRLDDLTIVGAALGSVTDAGHQEAAS